MDEKGSVTSLRRHTRWTDVSVLILSLLLAACVATIIYMSLQPAASNKFKSHGFPTAHQPPINISVKFNNKEIPEKMSYDEDHNVVFAYDNFGGFVAEDYDRGLAIMKSPESDICAVMPIGSTLDRSQVQSVFSRYSDGDEIPAQTGKVLYAQIIPGLIQDTSIFPEEANQRCTGGYQWLTTVDTATDESFEVRLRKRRQVELDVEVDVEDESETTSASTTRASTTRATTTRATTTRATTTRAASANTAGDDDCSCPVFLAGFYLDDDFVLQLAFHRHCIDNCSETGFCTLSAFCNKVLTYTTGDDES